MTQNERGQRLVSQSTDNPKFEEKTYEANMRAATDVFDAEAENFMSNNSEKREAITQTVTFAQLNRRGENTAHPDDDEPFPGPDGRFYWKQYGDHRH